MSGASGSPIVSDTAPASPTIGMQWFNSSTGKSYLYYSDAWVEMDSNGANLPVFANAVARATAVTNPVVGMTTYLQDSKNLEVYDGTAHKSTSGATLLANASFTSQTTVNIDNVFSANYDYYKILVNITGTSTFGMNLQLRASGSPITANYAYQRLILFGSTFSNTYITTEPSIPIGDSGNGQATYHEISVVKPFQAQRTQFYNFAQTLRSGVSLEHYAGVQQSTTSATGFNLICASAISGDVRVYGMRN